jgi:hypothetical protein
MGWDVKFKDDLSYTSLRCSLASPMKFQVSFGHFKIFPFFLNKNKHNIVEIMFL